MKRLFNHPAFPIVVAPIILFSPLLFTGKSLFWGTPSTQFVPWWEFAWNTILEGGFPLWNPWVGMGAPLIANYQSALFYPPYWAYLVFYIIGGIKFMTWGMTVIVTLHLIWAGLGTVKLLDDIGIGKLGQTIGGLAFALSGYLVSRAGFLSINATTAWIPWILYFVKGLSTKNKKYIWMTGLVFGMQFLAGHAQTAWYTVLLGGFWVTYWSLDGSDSGKRIQDTLCGWIKYIGAGLLGLAISAIQIIPTMEYLLQSQRVGEFGYEEAMTYSFWPWRFLTFFAPGLFGNPATGDYWGYGNYWEDAVYLGLIPIILVIGLLIRSIKKQESESTPGVKNKNKRQLVLFLGFIIFLSILFALGKNTVIFPFLYRNIPTFDLFQAPSRFMIWAEISLAVLAGIAIDQLKRPEGRALYWTRLAGAGCFAITASSVGAWIFPGDINSTFITATLQAGITGLIFTVALLLMPEGNLRTKKIVWNYVIILIVSVDLIATGWMINPGIKAEFYKVSHAETRDSRLFIPERIEYDLKFKRFFTFDSFYPEEDWEGLFDYHIPNINMLQRIEMVNNFDPIVPARYQIWMEEINKQDLIDSPQIIEIMNIGRIIKRDNKGTISVFDIPDSGEKYLRLIGCALIAENGLEALDLVLDDKINLYHKIILETNRLARSSVPCDQIQGEVKILEQSPGYLKLSVDLKQDSWIFWSQTWYPGWKGRIDGKEVDVERANYLFQTIFTEKGNHVVEFLYKPDSFFWGVGFSLAGLAILTGGLVGEKKKNASRS
jgi:hypothetical protein